MSLRNHQDYTLEAVLAGLLFLLLLNQIFNNLRSQPLHGLGSVEQTFSCSQGADIPSRLGQSQALAVTNPQGSFVAPGPATLPCQFLPGVFNHSAQKPGVTNCSLKQTEQGFTPPPVFSPFVSIFLPLFSPSSLPNSFC